MRSSINERVQVTGSPLPFVTLPCSPEGDVLFPLLLTFTRPAVIEEDGATVFVSVIRTVAEVRGVIFMLPLEMLATTWNVSSFSAVVSALMVMSMHLRVPESEPATKFSMVEFVV